MCLNCSTQDEDADLRSFRVLYSNTNGQISDEDATENRANPEYETLQRGEIRLLTLHSPSDFSLERVSLTDDLQYVAASYRWGDVGKLHDARINGHSVLLRENVFEMLRQLYLTHRVTRLWLDMMCINQSDPDEKSRQVPLMGEIYTKATKVFAWLGEADSETDLVFDVLCEFRDHKKREPYPDRLGVTEELSYYRNRFCDIWREKSASVLGKNELDDGILPEDFKWLIPFYARPYWSRVWVVQELILAKMVLICCGDKSIDLDEIYGLSLNWSTYGQIFGSTSYQELASWVRGWPTTQAIREHRWRRKFGDNKCLALMKMVEPDERAMLNEVVEVYAQYHKCSCPKDKIYGFRELLPRWKKELTVDYRQSDREVYIEAAKLGLFDKTQGGGWQVSYTLWSAMGLGGYEEFKDCVSGFMPDGRDRTSKWPGRPPRLGRSSTFWKEKARKIFASYEAFNPESKIGMIS